MIHALIVSPRGCGASELIQDVLAELNRPVSGFLTKKEDALADEVNGSPIYLYQPDKPRQQTEENRMGYCKRHHFRTIPGAFDRYAAYLEAPVSPDSVILMDVLGFMEVQEEAFCQAIMNRLNGEIPVIAAVKDSDVPFLNQIRSHPNCRCFYLNRENREEIFREVLRHMRRQLAGPLVAGLDPRIAPDNNLEALNDYLSLLEPAFSDPPQYTASRWDKRADVWEKERRHHTRDDERVIATVEYLTQRGILTPQSHIADIGCGPGRFVAAFAQTAQQVVGLDISENMVTCGNQHIQSLGLSNAQIHCCDFSTLDIRREGYAQAFDLVFSSLTPAVHNLPGLMKSMEMSRAWCLNISYLHRCNNLRSRILSEVFHRDQTPFRGGRSFYALFNILFLLGYEPETSFFTRRKEKRARPDGEFVEYILEHALPFEEHTPENAEKIHRWLLEHTEEDGLLTDVSHAVYGRILWDVRKRSPRPDFHGAAE